MIKIEDWGLIGYMEAWERQKQLVAKIQSGEESSTFVVCEHPTVITAGRATKEGNINVSVDFLKSLGVDVIQNDRGGDVTLHNPGQLVGYPIFDLKQYKQDLHWFLREIEDCIIQTIASYGIVGDRVEGLTGVWLESKRKICAIGMHCSRWVTSHGFALNVKNNLNEFFYIIPCGITDKEVTSISKEIGTEVDFDEVKKRCIEIFMNKF
jgi:lipoyl(octanoyl) transferase